MGDFKVIGSVANFYEWTWDLKFIPLAITPFFLDLTWIFPEAVIFDNVDWDMRVTGAWDIHGLWFKSTMTENLKIFTESIIDFAKDTKTNKIVPTQWS